MNEYTLTFTQQQLDTIGHALGEIPFRLAAPVVQSINAQIAAQQQAAAKAPEAGDKSEGDA